MYEQYRRIEERKGDTVFPCSTQNKFALAACVTSGWVASIDLEMKKLCPLCLIDTEAMTEGISQTRAGCSNLTLANTKKMHPSISL